MSEMRRYGGIGLPEDQFTVAAQAMLQEDMGHRDIPVDVGHYKLLLDAALHVLFPGAKPFIVKDFSVGVEPFKPGGLRYVDGPPE